MKRWLVFIGSTGLVFMLVLAIAGPIAAQKGGGTEVPGQTATLEAALQRAADFTGSNTDWEPFFYTLPDDPVGAEMALVPVGRFVMGSTDAQQAVAIQACIDEYGAEAESFCRRVQYAMDSPANEQVIETPYWIDRTEVTRAQYAACVEANGCSNVFALEQTTYADTGRPTRPITGPTWFEARDYCAWRGMRLPTEVEWEYAARGPAGWLYPWGEDWNPDLLVWAGNTSFGNADVGSRPEGASWVGALDLLGNVREWVSSPLLDYPYAPDHEQPVTRNHQVVMRGGSTRDEMFDLNAIHRSYAYPTGGYAHYGLRCVRLAMEPPADSLATATPVAIPSLEVLDSPEAALADAARFTGGNADWQPRGYVFPDDPARAEMVLVPVGRFMMGSETGNDDERPVHEQIIATPYWLDRTEVTRTQYRACVSAGACTASSEDPTGLWPAQPIASVTWVQAADYCAWRGMRLPTEVEWEYAARGPDGWAFPWGNERASWNAVWYGNSGRQAALVGAYRWDFSWVGAQDMAGNVAEWVSSLYLDYPYDATHEDSADQDGLRVYRGGDFGSIPLPPATGRRRARPSPSLGVNFIGLRCARF